jgi:zinc transporter
MLDATLPPLAHEHEDLPGLVWAYRLAPGEVPRAIPAAEVEAALEAEEGWVWLHVHLVDQRAHGWVTHACALPASACAILEGHDDGFALGEEAGVVHGIAADFHKEFDRTSGQIGRLVFAVSEHLLVTGRRHPLASVEEVRKKLDAGFSPATAFDLFAAIVFGFCRNANARLRTAGDLLDAVEDHLVNAQLGNERRRLTETRRLAVSLHRPVAALVALFKDEEREDWLLPPAGHEALQRLAARLETLDHDVAMVNDRARLLQEEIAAQTAEDTNRSLRALTIVSALMLPGTLVAGIFGMNTAGLPLTGDPSGFWIALALAVVATGLFYWLLVRLGASLRL